MCDKDMAPIEGACFSCMIALKRNLVNFMRSSSIEVTMLQATPLLKTGRGIYILYKDVKSCPCEDVHVLWSILVESGAASASLPSK
ncbi:uncharacterized protein HKW66_Vig0050730 [Vigna angularis]|uniref:Uncharacterized protein n=1 Tax=Phaseolus angularis TaxID=3914 RepID=A0A8T0L4D8_PHAAN|nr:uncharacterized protein HKW66_Vig0050730 [Vigna angularis]